MTDPMREAIQAAQTAAQALKDIAANLKPGEPKPDKSAFDFAEEAAEQIWREQQLTGSRLSWNLTFQGFLFAAYGIVFARSPVAPLVTYLLWTLAGAGIIVAVATYLSVHASQIQRDYLKRIWEKLYRDELQHDAPEGSDPIARFYPRYFSIGPVSSKGRGAPIVILGTVGCMWVIFGILSWQKFGLPWLP